MKRIALIPLLLILLASGRQPTAPLGDPTGGDTGDGNPTSDAGQATAVPTATPQAQPDSGPYWSQGQIWADTSEPGYCPGYAPYETNSQPPSLSWPVDGGTLHPGRGFRIGHTALDIDAPFGRPVRAAASGVIVWAGVSDFFGGGALVVAVSHGNGWVTIYAHLSEVLVDCWQGVTRGQIIGRVGMTGAASFLHLHFDLRNGRYSWNPELWLD
jgi:lipoprotein NlpD